MASKPKLPLVTPQTNSYLPTAARAWKRQTRDGELYRLPGSGHVARLRRPSLMALAARAGDIPNPLADEVIKLLAGGAGSAMTETDETKRMQLFREHARAMVEVARLSFVEPRIADTPDYEAGEIAPEDLHDRDIMFCYFELAQGEAAALADFRLGHPLGEAA